jgi:ADP-ribose pyrophosphatase YjhB (NUDIX family)
MGERSVSGAVRPVCDSCGAVVFFDPKLAVVVVVSHEEKILMVKRDIEPMMGRWSFPSGYVDRGEIVEEAAVREVREETSVEVALNRLLGVYSSRAAPVVLVAFAASVRCGVAEAGDETQAVGWFPVDELPPLPFPHDDTIMRDWRDGTA